MGSQPENFIFLPFHAAEQHSKERISDSAEYPREGVRLSDVARSLQAAQGSPVMRDQVIGCTFFWFVFFMQVKKMNIIKTILNITGVYLHKLQLRD